MLPKTSKDKTKSPVQPQESVPSFIRKTYDILEEAKFPSLIDWTPDGTALVIKKPAEFAQKVLPAYFKHNNLTSFVRQLNMYNFHKRRTLNVGHVYFHELFQKGKRHLLKEIKRKSNEQGTEKAPKTETTTDSVQPGRSVSALSYENQYLKQLYNDALSKISLFEGQVKELMAQNRSLWAQLGQQGEQQTSIKPLVSPFEKEAELTKEQLPMTLGTIGGTGRVDIPPLKIVQGVGALNQQQQQINQMPTPNIITVARAHPNMTNNVNPYMNVRKESAVSTEASRDSPNPLTGLESEERFELPRNPVQTGPEVSTQFTQRHFNPYVTNTQAPNVPQTSGSMNGLNISNKEMSVGTIFAAWNMETQNAEMLCFADQKRDNKENSNIESNKPLNNPFQDTSVLGKRLLGGENQDAGDERFNVPEPQMKRHELSLFNRRGLTSTGTEENEGNIGMDIIDFKF